MKLQITPDIIINLYILHNSINLSNISSSLVILSAEGQG